MDQKRRGEDMNANQAGNPNRDTAEGERGLDSDTERNRSRETDRNSRRGQSSSGITNRRMDEELGEQRELPERGTSRDESFDQSER
jgi:hypothetical protein